LAEGEHATIIIVFEFPPSDSCRIRVSLELRYGTCGLASDSAAMTRQSAESDALIFFASSSVSPLEPVLLTFSEPARSAMFSFETLTVPSGIFCCRLIVSSACEREEQAFIRVEPTIRDAFPHWRQAITSPSPITGTSVSPST
jgi:hypothetical protein